MPSHRVSFIPSGRSVSVPHNTTLLNAARLAEVPIPAECGGRGACGRCLVRIVSGDVPEYRVLQTLDGSPRVLACLTPVQGPLTVEPLATAELPRLISHERAVGVAPLSQWTPWPLPLAPLADGLGVAVDIGTTTLRLLVIRLSDGVVVGEAGAYNPQIALGADVITRIVASEKGALETLARDVRGAVKEMIVSTGANLDDLRAYVVAGNLTMIHFLLGRDASWIRRIDAAPQALEFSPVEAASLGWPGKALVHTLPAAGGWVGGDVVAGCVRAGLSRQKEKVLLYVDLGTNGEIILGGSEFATGCACSAGPAFEGGSIRCGMRADAGAVDGARIDERLEVSVIGGGPAKGLCGSGLIAMASELFGAGWIDRSARFTSKLPAAYRMEGAWGTAVRLGEETDAGLWERDLQSLVRAKAAVFSGIRSLLKATGLKTDQIDRVVVSGNFGRFLNLPGAIAIGLLPDLPAGRYAYVDNGALEGAALSLLSKDFFAEIPEYLRKITYVDLSELPGYTDEFVAASFLPHTDPASLKF